MAKWELPRNVLESFSKEQFLENKEKSLSLMLERESTQQYRLRNRFGYFNYLTYLETSRLMRLQFTQLAGELKEFCSKQVQCTTYVSRQHSSLVPPPVGGHHFEHRVEQAAEGRVICILKN